MNKLKNTIRKYSILLPNIIPIFFIILLIINSKDIDMNFINNSIFFFLYLTLIIYIINYLIKIFNRKGDNKFYD